MTSQPGSLILMVEDSPEDVEATVRAFRESRFANPLRHCSTGDEALDFLYHRGPYSDPAQAPRPSLILLDLNLPGTDGREVLAQVKGDAGLRRIPVIVLTTSSHPDDVRACYDAGANSYVTKPVDLPGLLKAIRKMADYWFEIVLLPDAAGRLG